VLWYGLSASVFSFWLWMKGIRHVDGSLAGVFCGLLPIAAALYGIVLPGEHLTIAHGIALARVVAGIVLASVEKNGAVDDFLTRNRFQKGFPRVSYARRRRR
jgi:drug/metabolite transporter (DMT)-like permease